MEKEGGINSPDEVGKEADPPTEEQRRPASPAARNASPRSRRGGRRAETGPGGAGRRTTRQPAGQEAGQEEGRGSRPTPPGFPLRGITGGSLLR
eukprot:6841410-Heterocapsa_arctica.AAC.1